MREQDISYPSIALEQPNESAGPAVFAKNRMMNDITGILYNTAFCLLLGVLVVSCNKDNEGPSSGKVGIRIENLSNFTFDEVLLETGGGGEQEYFDIPPGGITGYKPFNYTYRYAYIRAILQDDTLTLQPIDFFGEQKFTEGNFTFRLDIVGEAPLYLVLEFRED